MNLVGGDWSNGASPRNIADARYLETSHGRIAKQHDISRRDLSILFALRRAAEPLTPTRLLAEIALTLAAMAPSQREPELAVFLQLAPEETEQLAALLREILCALEGPADRSR